MSKPLSLEQKAFNAVVKHARKQNTKAKNDLGFCCYRAKDGKRCFIGCILPDRLYKKELEKKRFDVILKKFGDSILSSWKYRSLDQNFGNQLQNIHDNTKLYNWECEFRNFAKVYSLKYTPPVVAAS